METKNAKSKMKMKNSLDMTKSNKRANLIGFENS